MQLRDCVALVTGGASGLGRAVVEEFVGAGARAVILDLLRSAGAEVAAALGEERVRFAPADVTNEAEVEAAVRAAFDAFGGLRIVVNCAGIGAAGRVVGREGPMPLERFRRVIEVNLIGTFNVIRLAAARMVEEELIGEERGVIINTASIAAFDGQIGQAPYSASKGGIVGMTLPIARDLASRQIRCVTIAPGVFDTPLLAGLPEPARTALAEDVPHPHRLGQPREFAMLARHIVENPMLNGDTIRLDGALRMKPR